MIIFLNVKESWSSVAYSVLEDFFIGFTNNSILNYV